MLNKLLHFSTI